MFTDISVGDVIEVKRVITVVEINPDGERIKIKWDDKFGNGKEMWITYKMFMCM
jgi:hypothetical protein